MNELEFLVVSIHEKDRTRVEDESLDVRPDNGQQGAQLVTSSQCLFQNDGKQRVTGGYLAQSKEKYSDKDCLLILNSHILSNPPREVRFCFSV